MKHYKVYPASPEGCLFHGWQISLCSSVSLSTKLQKNVPRYADGEYLDSLAELFKDLERLPASPASAMFLLHIAGADTISNYPGGHKISFDGAILFETKEILEIKAGQTY